MTTTSAALPALPLPLETSTIVPAPTVSVAPALTVSVPVMRMRELAGHSVSVAMVPLTSVNTGASSIATTGSSVSPQTLASTWSVPAAPAAGADTDPQPRRSCTGVAGKPPIATVPLSHSGSPAAVRRVKASGTGSPAGQAAGAITLNTPPANAEGASLTVRHGVCGGIPSSEPLRDGSRTMKRTVTEATGTFSAVQLSAFSSW